MGKSYSKTKKREEHPQVVPNHAQRAVGGQVSAPRVDQVESSMVPADGVQNDATLRMACELVLRVGSLVHQVQLERGMTAIFVGSGENKMQTTLELLRLQTDKSLEELEKVRVVVPKQLAFAFVVTCRRNGVRECIAWHPHADRDTNIIGRRNA